MGNHGERSIDELALARQLRSDSDDSMQRPQAAHAMELNHQELARRLVAVQAREAELAHVLASADVAAVILSAEQKIRNFTTPVTALIPLAPHDIGRSIHDIAPRYSDVHLQEDSERTLTTAQRVEREVTTGDQRTFVRRVAPYFDGQQPIGLILSLMEITAVKRVEQTLLAERNFVDTVLSTVGALVIVVDRDGAVVRFNKACEEASGYRFEEVRGRVVWDTLVLPEEVARLQQIFAQMRSGSFPTRVEAHWRNRNGTIRLIEWNNTCLLDTSSQVEYVIGTGIDVTDRRRAQDEAQVHSTELNRVHRLHVAGEMAAALAHELNQPLAAITSYCDASLNELKRGTLSHQQLAYILEQTARQAQRAGRTIRELRAFLSKAEIQKTPCDLNALVRSAGILVGPDAALHGIELRLQLHEPMPAVLASDLQIEHVLINLMRNAIEAIRDGSVRTREVIVITQIESGQRAKVTVRDSGPGIGAATAERIFEPFFTTKHAGLGMGLQISRSIVQAHGGRLWAEPHEPGGVLHFTLPFLEES